ncbi:MAG: hypothetical protein EP330_22015 [Deltaproteobacteria bacterium]|nr:MAG: hypothetical protein EP330_22015 [Deltaproteobacteria bacterium]
MAKQKVAILGGGPSGMTCAWHLSSTPELREKYDITIYTMGHRAGGKGVSGRGPNGRIEEHGLHVLFGFYQNFFSMIRQVYEQLDRPPEHPLATWREAFSPRDYGVVEDYYRDEWRPWNLGFPGNRGVPGDGTALNSSIDYASMLLQGLIEAVAGWRTLVDFDALWFPRGKDWLSASDEAPWWSGRPDLGVKIFLRLMKAALKVLSTLADAFDERLPLLVKILDTIQNLVWRFIRRLSELSIAAHRFWLGIDMWIAIIRGIVVDKAFEPGGIDRLDELDYREWLVSHNLHPQTAESPFVRTIYDAAFSYEQGRSDLQRCAAGSSLRCLLRMAFTYKGAAYYKMNSGMGDAVFAPLYLSLVEQGVRFEFFQQVTDVVPSADGSRIDSVKLMKQAKLRKGVSTYDPLVMIKGLECWPSKPNYDQLADADKLRKVNLDTYYSGWKGVGRRTLKAGKDFDLLVYAMPVATIKFVAPKLMEASQKWRECHANVKSVTTVAFQTWTFPDLHEMGWKGKQPLLSLYVEPLNTWSDMSQTLPSEAWPSVFEPKNVGYFCGPQEGPADPPLYEEDPEFFARNQVEAKRLALEFMRNSWTGLLPKTVNPAEPPCIDWKVLVDPQEREGQARFDSQYWRSNCGPSERCTLSLPKSNRYRLAADETDFENLVACGDWIKNGLYLACMEGAIQGGIYAARAVSGVSFPIIGEKLIPGV